MSFLIPNASPFNPLTQTKRTGMIRITDFGLGWGCLFVVDDDGDDRFYR